MDSKFLNKVMLQGLLIAKRNGKGICSVVVATTKYTKGTEVKQNCPTVVFQGKLLNEIQKYDRFSNVAIEGYMETYLEDDEKDKTKKHLRQRVRATYIKAGEAYEQFGTGFRIKRNNSVPPINEVMIAGIVKDISQTRPKEARITIQVKDKAGKFSNVIVRYMINDSSILEVIKADDSVYLLGSIATAKLEDNKAVESIVVKELIKTNI